MLNRGERYEVLRMIRRCCNFGLLPAHVDLSTWDFLPRANWKHHMSFFLLLLNGMYKMGGFARMLFLKIAPPVHEMVLHTGFALSAAVYIYWYYVLYIKYPYVFGVYVKMTLIGNSQEGAVDCEQKRSWYCRLKQCTPQDLYAMSLPFMIASGVVAALPAFILYPSMRPFLFAALPKEYQTRPMFTILLLEEIRFTVTLFSIPIPVWMLQIISFELVKNKLELLVTSLQRPVSLEHVYKSLRHIQLYVGITNLINCYLIYTFKVLCITVSIGTGCAAIAHFSDHPFFGILYYIIFFNLQFIYTFCFDQAFKIPALFEQATKIAVLQVRDQNSRRSKMFKIKIRSIRRVEIKVGEFHTMERESTLRFIDFVLNNIVSMLVATKPT